jgi:transposase
MGRALSRDLRDRVVAAVERGVSCRRAAERFGSAASAIRWRQLVLAHGTPAAKSQGGDRRTPKTEDHEAFILEAIEQQPDPTLAELREMLAERGVSISIAKLWRFFARHGITRKKDRPRDGAGSSRRPEAPRGMVRGPARSRPRQAGLHRRDLGVHQHGTAPWPLPERSAPARPQGMHQLLRRLRLR